MITCEICKYWVENGKGNIYDPETGDGRCHKNAPIQSNDDWHEWPPTRKDDWCGEGSEK